MPKKFTVTGRWKNLGKEEQVRQVREAMAAKHTNKTAAALLGTTPNAVAGIRHRHGIPALFKKEKAGTKEKPAPPKERVVSKPKPEPPAPVQEEAPPPRPARVKQAPQPPRRKLAASEATQCTREEDGSRCAYERAPGSDKCWLHK